MSIITWKILFDVIFCSCEAVDAVMIFITINGRRERLDNFCGNKLPAQLMSNGPTMEVEFKSYHSSQEVKGFRAIYRFVTGEFTVLLCLILTDYLY